MFLKKTNILMWFLFYVIWSAKFIHDVYIVHYLDTSNYNSNVRRHTHSRLNLCWSSMSAIGWLTVSHANQPTTDIDHWQIEPSMSMSSDISIIVGHDLDATSVICCDGLWAINNFILYSFEYVIHFFFVHLHTKLTLIIRVQYWCRVLFSS